MRVYVETNFILELVLEQAEHDACDSLLNLASQNKIQLVLPAFSIFEAQYTMDGKMKAWKQQSYEGVRTLLKETKRTKRLEQIATNALALLDELKTAVTADTEQRLQDFQVRMLNGAELLPLDRDVFLASESLKQEFGLKSPDALVLASVLGDPKLGTTPSLFLSRDTKAFDDESVTERLREKSCQVKGSFQGGLHLVRQELGQDIGRSEGNHEASGDTGG